jgi:hypothetical protein
VIFNHSGGSTGTLFKCSSSLGNPSPILIRFYNETRDRPGRLSMQFAGDSGEQLIFQILSDANFGPKLYDLFYGGRIEQFISVSHSRTFEIYQ